MPPRLTLVGRFSEGRASHDLYRSLKRRGVTLVRAKATERSAEAVRLDDGRELPCDQLVVATGLKAKTLDGNMLRGPTGGVAIAATLRSAGDPAIFACGDCADFLPRSLPRHGVFGVRQAAVLARNLAAAADGEPLADYRPQQRWLSIMDLGNGEGFATWGPLAWRGRGALALKRRLDLAFVGRFQC